MIEASSATLANPVGSSQPQRRIARWAERSARPREGVCRLQLAMLLVVAATPLLSGCAYSALESPLGLQPQAVARGRLLAERSCGVCHGLGAAGESNFPEAPPLRTVRYDYNAISFARATAEWHSSVAFMPPTELSDEDIADIGSYIRSLKKHPLAR